MHYFNFHLGDYAKDTSHLSMLEHGAYVSMLRTYYTSDAALSKDHKVIHRLCGAKRPQEKAAIDKLLREFFILESDGYHHKRCDAEINKFREKSEKAKRSAQAKWAANAMRTHTERSANAMLTNNQYPITKGVAVELNHPTRPNEVQGQTIFEKALNPKNKLTHEQILDQIQQTQAIIAECQQSGKLTIVAEEQLRLKALQDSLGAS